MRKSIHVYNMKRQIGARKIGKQMDRSKQEQIDRWIDRKNQLRKYKETRSQTDINIEFMCIRERERD